MTEVARPGDPVVENHEDPYHDLWTKPFRENTDPGFLWLGPQYRDAFAALRAAVLQNVGLFVLAGDVGTGKTMLARALADSFRAEGVRVSRLAYAGRHPSEFWNAVAQALDLPGVSENHAGVPAHLEEFLRAAYTRREKILLVIDEAQDLVPIVLDEIQQLARAGLEAGRGKVNVMNVLLVGQPAVDGLLGPHTPGGGGSIAVRLGPLPHGEVAAYMAFRLRVAGADRALFSRGAIAAIATASAGVPRLINRICDYALRMASQRGERVVSEEIVAETLSDFGLSRPERDWSARWWAGPSVRRVAFAGALTLAVGLGAVVYRGGATNIAEPHRPQDLAPVSGLVGAPMGGPAAVVSPSPPAVSPTESAEGVPVPEQPSLPSLPDYPRRGGASVERRPAAERPSVQPGMSSPRPGSSRIPKPSAASRADRVEPERSPIPTAIASPGPVRVPTAAGDRKAEKTTRVDSAPEVKRPDSGGSEGPDDPAAIINWLLQGNRPGIER